MSLITLLESLEKHEVAYCLVGGFAAVSHGSTMVTQDVDVACLMTSENLTRLYRALEPYAPRHRMMRPNPPFTHEEAGSGRFRNLYLTTSEGQIDCLGEVKGIGDFKAVLAVSETLSMGKVAIKVLSLSALIQAKEAMRRPKDVETIKILKAIQQSEQS